MKKLIMGVFCGAAILLSVAANAAAYTFAGSWNVNDGPYWYGSPPNGPLAYTGLEAAAFLFGGSTADYAISSIGTDAATVNHMAWYDVIGVGQNLFAEGYSNKYLGLYYGPTGAYNCCGYAYATINAASTFVRDNTSGLTNYAFRITPVPEPETYAMLLAGLGLLGFTARRRKDLVA